MIKALLLAALILVSGGRGVPDGGGGEPPGEEITTFTLTSPNTGTHPFMLGHAFAEGDVTSASDIVSDTSGVTLRAVPKRLWNDGSVKHAVLVGTAAMVAATPLSISLKTGTEAGGVALTAADIATAAPSASIQIGAVGTVTLGDLLASPFRTWISTTEMVEAHYRSVVGAHADLVSWWYVRLWSDGTMHVRVAVENGFLNDAASTQTHTVTAIIGGATVHNASVAHYAHTRYDVDGWIGGDPDVTPAHSVQYLVDTKLVSNYWKRSPSAGTLNGLEQTYTPMQLSPHPVDGGAGGFSEHIGPMPNWDALYVTTADSRAHAAVIAASRALTTYAIARRSAATNRIAKPSDASTYSLADFSIINTAGRLEFNHLQNTGFLAYLITGEYFHYETMAHLTAMVHFVHTNGNGSGTNRILLLETRGTGENLRQLGHFAAIAPREGADAADLAIVTEYQTLLANNAAYWADRTQDVGMNPLGTLYQYVLGAWDTTGTVAVWMQQYWVGAMGQVSNMAPLADMTDWNAARDWMYRWPVGLAGTVGATNFCYTRAGSEYGVEVNNDNDTDPTTFYGDWGEVWTNTFGSANTSCPDGGTLQGTGSSAPNIAATNHRWSVFLQAIAYAVEHNATGADAAWARFIGASNFSAIETGSAAPDNFNDTPVWGIVPRGFN